MGNAEHHIFRFLTDDGLATGQQNANGNYAAANTPFYYSCEQDRIEIHRMIIHIEDTQGMTAAEYGNLGSALANGYSVRVMESDGTTELIDLCDGTVITTNASLGRYCYDVDVKTWGSGNESLQARWTFAKSGSPIILDQGQRIQVDLNDNFTGLVEHYFMLQGFY